MASLLGAQARSIEGAFAPAIESRGHVQGQVTSAESGEQVRVVRAVRCLCTDYIRIVFQVLIFACGR